MGLPMVRSDAILYDNEAPKKTVIGGAIAVAASLIFGVPMAIAAGQTAAFGIEKNTSVRDFDEFWHGNFRNVFGLLGAVPKMNFDATLFHELWSTDDGFGGDADTYVTFIGKVIMNDGKIIRARQDQNTGDDGLALPHVYHVNHFNDRTVGYQGNIARGTEETGYMGAGNWTLDSAAARPEASDPKVTFNCWFAVREPLGGKDEALPTYAHDVVDNRNEATWPRSDVYNSETDELPYKYKKMTFVGDSEALIELDAGKSGSYAHHSGIVGDAWFWNDAGALGYFHKHARLDAVLHHIVAASFSQQKDEDNVCTTFNPKVQVRRRGSYQAHSQAHVMNYELITEVPQDSTPLTPGSAQSIEEGITQCHWIGQDDFTPHFNNNIAPRTSDGSPNVQAQKDACYTETKKIK